MDKIKPRWLAIVTMPKMGLTLRPIMKQGKMVVEDLPTGTTVA
jgi:hypothetical protein